jgi:catechol 2,3-dioxygenase-like lactoylglutathione lyase family enzyme
MAAEAAGDRLEGSVNRFGHIDLRVADLAVAAPFYDALLPALGFTRRFHGDTWKVWAAEGELPSVPYFAVTEDVSHRANATRIAFWAPSREDVDRVAAIVKEAGALIESGPSARPEYSASYYAVYFNDPAGNRLEVVHRVD